MDKTWQSKIEVSKPSWFIV